MLLCTLERYLPQSVFTARQNSVLHIYCVLFLEVPAASVDTVMSLQAFDYLVNQFVTSLAVIQYHFATDGQTRTQQVFW